MSYWIAVASREHVFGGVAGGKDNGAPGPRPHDHEHYYGAFILDPDGHRSGVS